MKRAFISAAFPEFAETLNRMGFDTVAVKPYKNICDNAEAFHADMQILNINNKSIILLKNNRFNNKIINKIKDLPIEIIFTENEVNNFIYPECVKLNVAIVGNYAIGNTKYIDSVVLNILKKYNFELINVKQGYAKCATAIVNKEAIITSDISIFRAVKDKIDCLKITEGNISLCEKYSGFIGGASFLIDNSTLGFMGDITAHPDYINIKSFCQNHGVRLLSLSKSPLCDVGGVVVIS